MSSQIEYACLPNWQDRCVCKPGQKTDCGVLVTPPPQSKPKSKEAGR